MDTEKNTINEDSQKLTQIQHDKNEEQEKLEETQEKLQADRRKLEQLQDRMSQLRTQYSKIQSGLSNLNEVQSLCINNNKTKEALFRVPLLQIFSKFDYFINSPTAL